MYNLNSVSEFLTSSATPPDLGLNVVLFIVWQSKPSISIISRSSSFVSVRNIKSYSEINKAKSGDLSLVIKPQTLSRTHLILVTAGCKSEFCSVIKPLVSSSSQEDLPSPSYSTPRT